MRCRKESVARGNLSKFPPEQGNGGGNVIFPTTGTVNPAEPLGTVMRSFLRSVLAILRATLEILTFRDRRR